MKRVLILQRKQSHHITLNAIIAHKSQYYRVNITRYRIYKVIFGAKARRTINQSKRKFWKNYVLNLNMHTPINKVWNTI